MAEIWGSLQYEKYYHMYVCFPDSVKNSFYGKNFYARLIASKDLDSNNNVNGILLESQNEIPIISGIDTSYKKIIINKDFYNKHKYTLIEFWASWCGPCRKVNEQLKKMRNELQYKNVQVIGFSLILANCGKLLYQKIKQIDSK